MVDVKLTIKCMLEVERTVIVSVDYNSEYDTQSDVEEQAEKEALKELHYQDRFHVVGLLKDTAEIISCEVMDEL